MNLLVASLIGSVGDRLAAAMDRVTPLDTLVLLGPLDPAAAAELAALCRDRHVFLVNVADIPTAPPLPPAVPSLLIVSGTLRVWFCAGTPSDPSFRDLGRRQGVEILVAGPSDANLFRDGGMRVLSPGRLGDAEERGGTFGVIEAGFSSTEIRLVAVANGKILARDAFFW